MAEDRSKAATTAGGGPEASDRSGTEPRADLEGVRATSEDVGSLPVPRSVREQRERRPLERAVRRAVPPRPSPPPPSREEEARLRRSLPHAARTPEELGRALSRAGQNGLPDPQRGHEAGPPLPGDPGYHGDT
jgi:hypothetical protein